MSEQETGGNAYETRSNHDHPATAVCGRRCPGYAGMLAEKTAARHDTALTQNERGEWVPAIPLPYILAFGRARCECGEKFRNRRRYREHYALAHILASS